VTPSHPAISVDLPGSPPGGDPGRFKAKTTRPTAQWAVLKCLFVVLRALPKINRDKGHGKEPYENRWNGLCHAGAFKQAAWGRRSTR